MAKYMVQVRWTQELSYSRLVEAGSLQEARDVATAMDPDEGFDPRGLSFGDVVSDVEAVLDGQTVAINGCPLQQQEVDDE